MKRHLNRRYFAERFPLSGDDVTRPGKQCLFVRLSFCHPALCTSGMPGAGRFPRYATAFPRSLVASHSPFMPPEIVLAALRPLGKAVLGKAEGKFVQYT